MEELTDMFYGDVNVLGLNYKLLSNNYLSVRLMTTMNDIRTTFDSLSDDEQVLMLEDTHTKQLIEQMVDDIADLQSFLDDFEIPTVVI